MRKYLLLTVMLLSCANSVDETFDYGLEAKLIGFSPMYSAFDGKHTYALTPNVPSAAQTSKDADPVLASSIRWEVDDAFVKREEFPDLPAAIKLTTKKPGMTTVRVKVKTLSGLAVRSEAKLTISKATESEWEAGDRRYNEGSMNPELDRESQPECGLVQHITLPKQGSCSNCHDSASNTIANDLTPTQTAGYSNEDLIDIATQAAKRPDVDFTSPFLRNAPMPDCLYKAFHTWMMTDEEKQGIVWKIRSIAPKVAP